MTHKDIGEVSPVLGADGIRESLDITEQEIVSPLFRDEAQLGGVGGGVSVTQMIVAADDVASLGHLPHEGIVAGDVLGHAVEDVEDADGGLVGEVDLPC